MNFLKLIIYGLMLVGAFLIASDYAEPSNDSCSFITFSTTIMVLYFGYKILTLAIKWVSTEDDYEKPNHNSGTKSWVARAGYSRYRAYNDEYVNTINKEPDKPYSSYDRNVKITKSEKKQAEKLTELKSLRTDITIIEFKKK